MFIVIYEDIFYDGIDKVNLEKSTPPMEDVPTSNQHSK